MSYKPILVRIISDDCIMSHPSKTPPRVGCMVYEQTSIPKGTILKGSSPNRFTCDIFFDYCDQNGKLLLCGKIAERHYEVMKND